MGGACPGPFLFKGYANRVLKTSHSQIGYLEANWPHFHRHRRAGDANKRPSISADMKGREVVHVDYRLILKGGLYVIGELKVEEEL